MFGLAPPISCSFDVPSPDAKPMVLESGTPTKLCHFWGKCRCAYCSTRIRIWEDFQPHVGVELGRRLLYAFFEFFSERPNLQIGDGLGMGQGYQFGLVLLGQFAGKPHDLHGKN